MDDPDDDLDAMMRIEEEMQTERVDAEPVEIDEVAQMLLQRGGAVIRGELPPPVKLLGQPRWLASSIRNHIREKLETAAEQAQLQHKRLEGLRP